MSSPMPSPAELAQIPAGRNVVSFRLGVEPSGRVVLLKTRTEDGRTEALLLATPVARHIRDRLAETLRARPGLGAVPEDKAFFAAQPEIVEEDWAADSTHVGTPLGAHVETAGTSCVLAFPLDAHGRYTACRMTALQAAYYLHAVNAAEESGAFDSEDKGGEDKGGAPEGRTLH